MQATEVMLLALEVARRKENRTSSIAAPVQ